MVNITLEKISLILNLIEIECQNMTYVILKRLFTWCGQQKVNLENVLLETKNFVDINKVIEHFCEILIGIKLKWFL